MLPGELNILRSVVISRSHCVNLQLFLMLFTVVHVLRWFKSVVCKFCIYTLRCCNAFSSRTSWRSRYCSRSAQILRGTNQNKMVGLQTILLHHRRKRRPRLRCHAIVLTFAFTKSQIKQAIAGANLKAVWFPCGRYQCNNNVSACMPLAGAQ